MKLLHRFGYYLAGFAVGLIFLAFFLKGKNFSCDYGPQARVKKNINSKPLLLNNQDSLLVKTILTTGRIDFSKSESRKKPCGEYYIEALVNGKNKALLIENCDSFVKVRQLRDID